MERRSSLVATVFGLAAMAHTAGVVAEPAADAAFFERAATPPSAASGVDGLRPKGSAPPSVLVFDQGLGFPATFERTFDFDQLPFAGEYRDVTREGIRLRADGLRHWVHVDGTGLGGRAARQPDAAERWTIDLPPGSHALEFRMWESSNPGVGADTCYNFGQCTDTLYRVRVFGEAGALLRDFDYSPYDNRINAVSIWSSAPIASVVLTGELNNVDDEFLGDLRVATKPLPAGLRYQPSRQHGGFGRHAALEGSRAVITDSAGFELWRRSGPDTWAFAGRRDVVGTIERVAIDAGTAAIAVATPAGPRLRIHAITGDDPAAWPVTEIPYVGAARDLAVEGDIVMLGVDGAVRVHQTQAGLGWVFVYAIAPDPPITGADAYGRDLALDQGRLVVNAGRGLFHVYERGIGALFNEAYRQEESFTSRSFVDLSGTTVAVQTFEGSIRLYERNVSGAWVLSGGASGSLPSGIGLGLGAAIRIDGDRLLALQDFQVAGSPEFRQAVSVWSREPSGELVRAAVFVDPHLPPSGTARLGAFGQAFEIDGDQVLLGQPQTHWCDYGARAFIGDSGPQGFADVCGSRSGAALFASAGGLSSLFASSFER